MIIIILYGAYPTMKNKKTIRIFADMKKSTNNKISFSCSLLVDKSPIFNMPIFSLQIDKLIDSYEITQHIILKLIDIIVASKESNQNVHLIIYIKNEIVCFDWMHRSLSLKSESKASLWNDIKSAIQENEIELTLFSDSIMNKVV